MCSTAMVGQADGRRMSGSRPSQFRYTKYNNIYIYIYIYIYTYIYIYIYIYTYIYVYTYYD